MGRDFLGCYDLLRDRLVLLERSRDRIGDQSEPCEGLDDPKLSIASSRRTP